MLVRDYISYVIKTERGDEYNNVDSSFLLSMLLDHETIKSLYTGRYKSSLLKIANI
jgi:hypothetical protein